jgi:hypothetical protein
MIAVTETQVAAATDSLSANAGTRSDIQVPDDYRTSYQFLGSWSVAAEHGKGAQQIHAVYASPGAITAYQRDGHFPDGARLVKEVFEATTAEMTTGTVSHTRTLARAHPIAAIVE